MRTARDFVLILFGLALALFISSLQLVMNPANWESVKTGWCYVVSTFTVAIILIFIAVWLMRKLDRSIENQEQERHRTELRTELNTFREVLRQDIDNFLTDLRNEETKQIRGKTTQKRSTKTKNRKIDIFKRQYLHIA